MDSTEAMQKLPARYRDRARAHFRACSDEEFWSRHTWCARRLVTALAFRESATTAHTATGSVLLPPIGYYYSMFHLGIAALYLDYSTPTTELRQMKHSRLLNLVRAKLVDHTLLPDAFADTLTKLRYSREYANYVFGGKLSGDYEIDFWTLVPRMYEETLPLVDSAIQLIRLLSSECCFARDYTSNPGPIPLIIGDDIGDDAIRMYLSKGDAKKVWGILLATGLTT